MSYSIKEVAERFNISAYSLRYYEKENLLPAVHRAESGIRVYSDADLGWIQLICCMKASGMSIAYMKNYAQLCAKGNETVPERREIILNQKELIEKHIEEYSKLLQVVNKKLEHYDNIMDPSKKMVNPQK